MSGGGPVVNRSLVGSVSGALLVLAMTAFAMGAVEPLFRPIVAGTLLFGCLAAICLRWRRRRVRHPTIAPGSVGLDDSRPIGPK
jgi:hypothetical protein